MAKLPITATTVATNNVQLLDDEPTGQAPVIKLTMDQYGIDNNDYVNNILIAELNGDSGSKKIGHDSINVVADNVGDGLQEVAAKIAEERPTLNIASVLDFGAVGDGVTDDTQAFNDAIDYCAENAFALWIPETINSYRITSTLILKRGINILGQFVEPFIKVSTETGGSNVAERGSGSWLYFDHIDVGFLIKNTDLDVLRVTGGSFKNLGFYRNQPNPTGGWTPTVNDYDIKFAADANTSPSDWFIENVFLFNTHKGIFIGRDDLAVTGNSSRVWINGLYGQPLFEGIRVNYSLDHNYFNNVHFWPYWSLSDDVKNYTRQNAYGLIVERSDQLVIGEFFTHAYKGGLRYPSTATLSNVTLQHMGVDDADIGFLIEGDNLELRVLSFTFWGKSTASNTKFMLVSGDENDIQVISGRTNTHTSNALLTSGNNNRISIGDILIKNYGLGGSAAALSVSANDTLVMNGNPLYEGTGPEIGSTGTIEGKNNDTIKKGQELNVTPNINGEIQGIVHGLNGRVPTSMYCSVIGDTTVGCQIQGRNTLNFTIRLYSLVDGSDITSGTYNIDWIAFL